jgi:hypothetical protein
MAAMRMAQKKTDAYTECRGAGRIGSKSSLSALPGQAGVREICLTMGIDLLRPNAEAGACDSQGTDFHVFSYYIPSRHASAEPWTSLRKGFQHHGVGLFTAIPRSPNSFIEKYKMVDWETRDAVQARLRNIIRVVLRKYGYPPYFRDQVVENVLDFAKLAEDGRK